MLRYLLLLIVGGIISPGLRAQADTLYADERRIVLPPCAIVSDSIDPFDSLRTVVSEQVDLGNLLISQYETVDGPRLVPEAKAAVLHSELDSLSVLFIQLEMPEYNMQQTENGYHVKFLMASDSIVGFYTVSDRGTFSRETNMRHYQHTSLVPTNLYYLLTDELVKVIRVEYSSGHRRTIPLNGTQATTLREHFRCVGERIGYYPVNP